MGSRLRLGTTLIDRTDGRECVVCEVRRDGYGLRKRNPSGCGWRSIAWERGRFVRPGSRRYLLGTDATAAQEQRRRTEAIERYGAEVVRLAEMVGLTPGMVARIQAEG